MAAPIYFPIFLPTVYEGSFFSTSLTTFVIYVLFDDRHFWWVWGVLSLSFWFAFPWWLEMLSVFSCTYWSSAILLWKNIYSVLLPIFKYHLQIFPPIQLVFYSFFSMVSFAMQKLLILSQSVISVSQSCLTLCNPKDCSMPGFLVHYPLSEFAQTHVHWVSNAVRAFILCHPLLLLPIFSSIKVFSSESALWYTVTEKWYQ